MTKYYWKNRKLSRIRFRRWKRFGKNAYNVRRAVSTRASLRRNNPLRRYPRRAGNDPRFHDTFTSARVMDDARMGVRQAVHEAYVARAAAAGAAEGASRSMTPCAPSMEPVRTMAQFRGRPMVRDPLPARVGKRLRPAWTIEAYDKAQRDMDS